MTAIFPDAPLVFVETGPHRVAFLLSRVVQVLRMVELHPLPGAPAHCLGALDLRGTMIPVVDLLLRLGAPKSTLRPHERMLVVTSGEGDVPTAWAVDQVLDIRSAAIAPPGELSGQPVAKRLVEGFAVEGDARVAILEPGVLAQNTHRSELLRQLTGAAR